MNYKNNVEESEFELRVCWQKWPFDTSIRIKFFYFWQLLYVFSNFQQLWIILNILMEKLLEVIGCLSDLEVN